jgi:hypothetical protein
LPGDPTGTQAKRIADMMEIFGLNVFATGNGQDGQAGETVAGLTAAAQYLVGSSGLSILFRGYVGAATDYATVGPQLFAATGGRFMLNLDIGDAPDASAVIANAQASAGQGGWVQFVEGSNEPNNTFGTYQPAFVPVAAELAASQQLYSAVHPLGIQVASASAIGNYSSIASYWGSSLSADVAVTDLYNSHLYPNNGGPNGENQLHDWTLSVSQSDWGGKLGIVSEWQPVLFNNGPTDDTTCAYWTPIMLLSGYVDFQLQALMWWEAFDYQGYTPHSGLFNNTAASPYPAAKVMKAMFALTGDTGSNKHTFAPGKLDVTVTGLPPGDNPYNGGRYAVLENSAGSFFIFVWNEQNALATGTSTPVTVTFNAAPMTKVVDYSLTNPVSETPTPIQTLSHVTSLTMTLTTEVRLLQVTHP